MGYGSVNLTADNILSKISEEQIIEYYLGIEVNFNKLYTNPLRSDDTSAGCKFYVSQSTNRIKFRDFAEAWDEDCFGIVMRACTCNFPRALEQIAKDFNLFGYVNTVGYTGTHKPNSTIQKRVHKERSKITAKAKLWTKVDVKYWKSYYLNSEDLKEASVFSIKYAWLDNNDGNGNRLVYEYKDSDPCYAYVYPDKTIKLYFPFREYGRFLGNSKYIQGYNLLPKTGDHCIITKSYKDVLCMKKFGINSVAPQAESIILDPELFAELKQRFGDIYSLYDWDRAGIRGALKMWKQYRIIPVFFTRGIVHTKYNFISKDFADNLKEFGIQDTIDIIEYAKAKIYYNDFIKDFKNDLNDYVPF